METPFTREVELVRPNNTNYTKERVLYNAENYMSYLNKVGCHACLISPKEDPSIIDHLDFIVTPGGPDVNPTFYGQPSHPKTRFEKKGVRDRFEKRVIELAIERGKPIFAVCRGVQIVNTVLGGTLHQHLPDWSTEVDHRSPEGPTAYTHEVKTTGWVEDTFGKKIQVNSWHHQGIDKLASSLEPLAWSSDGLVEAYEATPELPSLILALQWHPEFLQDEVSITLLAHFIDRVSSQLKIGGE
ncbi:putative glutamine amidotransferase [Alteribacillus persepolensis]|uniref:Putative glutamine amidotransferase n=1 Tax=Alteribacillus persepolensis TaxID=568899 RepID=A0A1G8J4G4_9BACI|nr:gamma-glutamyl-gamma-aminobutyrate hydrolase family protein [Alteribacillus persepolensis]SDI25877.1 putative glutamine amidotransferase [Alteribacillus persepolensis]